MIRTPRLVTATAEELRLLRPSSLALWRSLVRNRDRHGWGPRDWTFARLTDLARWSRISYSTAKKALAQLKRFGLVAVHRTGRSRWARVDGVLQTVQANEENLYMIVGRLVTRCGRDTVMMPGPQWRSIVAGTPRLAFRLPVDSEVPRDTFRAKGTGSLKGREGLTRLRGPSDYPSVIEREEAETSEKALRADHPLTAEEEDLLFGEDDEAPRPAHEGPGRERVGRMFGGTGYRGDRPTTRCPYLPPDLYPKQPALFTEIHPDRPDYLKARDVIDGYRRAVKEVYGVEWWHFQKGDLKNSKYYPGFVKAGKAMSDHGVPPDHWAIWRLRWFAKGQRFRTTPPPIWVVMSAKTVSERAGWFRKEYQLPVPVLEHDPIIHEQNLRNQEAQRRWLGLDPFVLAPFPSWYVEKRKKEIAQGMDEPHFIWPTKPGSRYGRTS